MGKVSTTLKINDPVTFRNRRGPVHGFIASMHGTKAVVVTEDQTEYHVPVTQLALRHGVDMQRVYTKDQLLRLNFSVGDRVKFTDKTGTQRTADILRLNPKRAQVVCNLDQSVWTVPYSNLDNYTVSKQDQIKRQNKLDLIAKQADKLLMEHNLTDWRFTFDNAPSRGGKCSYRDQVISISEQFCFKVDDKEITETILHEIAHALAGENHGHDAVWQHTVKSIGGKPTRTHCITFTPPRYIVSCERCQWHVGRQQRRRDAICTKCKSPVTYQLYTPQLAAMHRIEA